MVGWYYWFATIWGGGWGRGEAEVEETGWEGLKLLSDV
jgi:hypothetical protein